MGPPPKKIQNRDRLKSLWDHFKHTIFVSQGCQEEKRKSTKLKTYLKKIMKENLPNLVKEVDTQVQETQRVPNKMVPKTHHN